MRKMVDLERTPEEKVEAMMPAAYSGGDYASGLCICLTQDELDKLDLDYSDVDIGDTLHVFAFAEVRSVSKTDGGCRLEMVITHMGLEDEDKETEPDEGDE